MAVDPNPHVKALEAYEITPQEPWQIHEDYNLHKLDWNEGAIVPRFVRKTALKLLAKDEYFNWYPDCVAIELTDALAKCLEVSVMNVLTFPGSDVALESLCRTYLSVGDRVLIPTPTYENFFSYAAASGGEILFAPTKKPYELNADALIKQYLLHRPKIIYLVSPNNPCGYVIPKPSVSEICRAFSESLIILDQAYVEFSSTASCVDLVEHHDNLVITRTFSKAFSLAGMRLGFIVAAHGILKNVAKIRNGKNIGMLAQKLGVELLKRRSVVDGWVHEVIRNRDWLSQQLTRLKVSYSESHANFILFELPDPKYAMAEFKRHGIYVRDRSKAAPNSLRVTVTTRASAEHFLQILEKLVSQ